MTELYSGITLDIEPAGTSAPFDTSAALEYLWADVPQAYVNTVYDTNLAQWVVWDSVDRPDEYGGLYPYDIANWKADSYSWQTREVL